MLKKLLALWWCAPLGAAGALLGMWLAPDGVGFSSTGASRYVLSGDAMPEYWVIPMRPPDTDEGELAVFDPTGYFISPDGAKYVLVPAEQAKDDSDGN